MSTDTDIPRVPPLPGQVFMTVPQLDDYDAPDALATTDIAAADVTTSLVEGAHHYNEAGTRTHKLVIDLDLPAKLIPSSTPGHFHLYVDKEIEETTYFELLGALASAGLIEPGYLGASLDRGFTAVRLPWVRKQGATKAVAA